MATPPRGARRADPPRRRGIGSSWLAWLALLGLGLLLLRLLGPGGIPWISPPAAESPSPAPDPAPAAPPPPAAGAEEGGVRRVRGTIRDAGGVPVGGARVEASWRKEGEGASGEERATATTASDGTFALEVRHREGPFRLFAARGPLVATDAEIPAAAGDDLVLELVLPATFDAAGVVIAEEDGHPLEGMTVEAGGRTTRTDALGRFHLEGIPAAAAAGAVEFAVTGEGRAPLRAGVSPDSYLDDLVFRPRADAASLPPAPAGR